MKRNNPYLTRRDFIKKTTALGVGLGVGVGLSSIIPSYSSPISHKKLSIDDRLEQNPLGYKGYQMDLASRHYLLGQGNRIYNPGIMRFHALDTMSPFGKGGINSYAYCLGDPVNRKDSNGHFVLLSFLIAAIIGAIVGAAIAAIAEGIRSYATGTPFEWKAVAIGAAVGFISGGFGFAASGTAFAVKLGLALISSALQAGVSYAINVASGMDQRQAAINAGITFGIGMVTFGIGTGLKHFMKNTVAGRALSVRVTRAGESFRATLRERLGFYDNLSNAKTSKFADELLQFRQTPHNNAYVMRIANVGDLLDELSQPGVHKFVIDRGGNMNIGTISGVHTKSLSHAVLGKNFTEDVVSAGYITQKFGRVIVVNHSGHFRPDFRSLWAAKDTLLKLGVENPAMVKASMNCKFLTLKAMGAF